MAFDRICSVSASAQSSGTVSKSTNARELESALFLGSDAQLETFLTSTNTGLRNLSPFVAVEIDNYPFFFIQYDLSTPEFRTAFALDSADIRLALCGDAHWAWKSKDIIRSSVEGANTSSRDSIIWLVNPEGTVKLVSRDIETSPTESLTAMLVETDIILTMRYFLQTINRIISRLADRTLGPSDLTDLRQTLFANMDKYCNIEISHKDTTRRRIEQLKEIFRIDSAYASVVDRFDLLGSRMAARNSHGVERQQILLTLVFGFFGALNVLYRVCTEISPKTPLIWYTQRIGAVVGSLIIALILWLIAHLVRTHAR